MKAAILTTGAFVAGAWSCMRNMQLPIGPNRKHWGPCVFGHRGCRFVEGVPENTLEAFEWAMQHGAKGVECDVRLSSDDHIVVFHDTVVGTMMKAPDPNVRVDQLDYVDLRQLRFIADVNNEGICIPTLDATIEFCRDNNLKLIIDIKELRRPKVCVDKLIKLYKRYGDFMYNNTLVIAFDPRLLYRIRKADPKIAVGILHAQRMFQEVCSMPFESRLLPRWIKLCPALVDRGLGFLNTKVAPWLVGSSAMCPCRTDYTSAYARQWHKRGMAVYLWGFETPEECLAEMRREGILVSADSEFDSYNPAKKEVTYATLFPDAPSIQHRQLGVNSPAPATAHLPVKDDE